MEQLAQGVTDEKLKRNTKSRCWLFVWNNYTQDDVDYIINKFKKDQYLFGKEVGAGGTPHLQGYLYFKNPRYFNTVRDEVKNHHIEACNNPYAVVQYSKKDGIIFTNMKKFKKPEKPPKVIEEFRPWQKALWDELDYKPDDRKIIWYYDKTGKSGKTKMCKHILTEEPHVSALVNGNIGDMTYIIANMKKHPQIVLINCARDQTNISYKGIEAIKDGLIVSTKFKSCFSVFPSPWVIVFANFEPDREKLTEDRWDVREL